MLVSSGSQLSCTTGDPGLLDRDDDLESGDGPTFSTTLVLREQNYVQAARALGASSPCILFREILPNTMGPIVVLASLGLGTAVIIESAMSFLGFGLPPPTPTWGWTLSYGTRFIRDEPWLSIISGATIMITVLGFNLLGDGLRDILDPRQLTRFGAKK